MEHRPALPSSVISSGRPTFQANRLLLSGPRLLVPRRPLWGCWPLAHSLALTPASSISSPTGVGEGSCSMNSAATGALGKPGWRKTQIPHPTPTYPGPTFLSKQEERATGVLPFPDHSALCRLCSQVSALISSSVLPEPFDVWSAWPSLLGTC